MKFFQIATAALTASMLSACGNVDGGNAFDTTTPDTTDTPQTVEVSIKDLVADEDFNFSSEQTVDVVISLSRLDGQSAARELVEVYTLEYVSADPNPDNAAPSNPADFAPAAGMLISKGLSDNQGRYFTQIKLHNSEKAIFVRSISSGIGEKIVPIVNGVASANLEG